MFATVPIDTIWVNREERQRRDLVNIPELAESLNRIGQIMPIVIKQDGELIAGERRWTAAKSIGWTDIQVKYLDELDEFELQAIELEENLKREDLSWQDKSNAIKRYHTKRLAADNSWTVQKTANALGLAQSTISNHLSVADALDAGLQRVVEAPKFSTALSVATREAERRAEAIKAGMTTVFKAINNNPEELLGQMVEEIKPAGVVIAGNPVPITINRPVPLLLEDFNEFAPAYTGRPFNFLHCDFPYGVNADSHAQGAASSFGGYDDSADIYWRLIDTLAGAMDNVVAQSAHMIFWFSMDFYQQTMERLTAMGWKVNPFPLIWHKSDNTGILPDANRGPRRTYETAFFCSRGDRKLTANGAVANSFSWPGRVKEIHMSEKPVEMLTHFMRMVVDDYTTMLDPTAGSANALKAAKKLGAPTVLGLEKSEEFFTRSVENFYKGEEDE